MSFPLRYAGRVEAWVRFELGKIPTLLNVTNVFDEMLACKTCVTL